MERLHQDIYCPINSQHKQYQLIKLSNGILTLLICDPFEKTASCSVTVGTGAFNDPDNLAGLSHLCEHMILAGGSKKYPEVNLFKDELSKNNGQRNAYTTGQETTFYFYIPNSNNLKDTKNYEEKPAFQNLLTIFGSCFEDPLFKKEELNNEIVAIDNEHSGNKANYRKLMYHGTRILSNEDHPFSRFATGDLNTLKTIAAAEKINVISYLKKYIDDHFYGSNMTLCLKSCDSINILAKLAESSFGGIKSAPTSSASLFTKLKIGNSSSTLDQAKLSTSISDSNVMESAWNDKIGSIEAFPPSFSKNALFIKGKESSNVLRIILPVSLNRFLMSGFTKKELAQFCTYWVEVFGEESKGSFDHYLKMNGYASSTLAFMTEYALNNDGLIMELKLTAKGWKNIDTIMANFKNSFCKELVSPESTKQLAKLFSQHNSLDLLKFLYQDVSQNPVKECSNFTSHILTRSFVDFVDAECILKSVPFVFSKSGAYFESSECKKLWLNVAKKWQQFLSLLLSMQDLKMIFYGSYENTKFEGTFKDNGQKDIVPITDSHFGFSYFKFHYKIDSIASCEMNTFNFEFENRYVPSIAKRSNNIILKALEQSKRPSNSSINTGLVINNSSTHTKPEIITDNDRCQIWIKKENHNSIFKSKSLLTVNLINDKMKPSALNTMFLEILTEIIGIESGTALYPAVKAGYAVTISPSIKGDINLKIQIDGFTDGLINILECIINVIKNYSINEIDRENLKKSRVNVRNKFETAANENGFKLALIGLYITLDKYVWNLEDRFEALEDEIDAESLRSFVTDFLKDLKIVIIQQGDVTKEHALSISSFISENLTHHEQYADKGQQFLLGNDPQTFKLPKGANCVVNNPAPDDDPNNSISYFIQISAFNEKKEDSLGLNAKELFALTNFTDFIFKIHLVSDLRVKRHLGYIVSGGSRSLSSTFGLEISAMSLSSPEEMEEKINNYLLDFEYGIEKNMSNDFFKEKYLNEYIKVLESISELGQILDDTSLPSDILRHVPPNFVLSSDNVIESQYNFHRKLVDAIATKRFNFDDLNFDNAIDKEFLKNLTLKKYLSFFKFYVSVKSPNRSKLSVHITTKMTYDMVEEKVLFMQITGFLKMKGFKFDENKINAIIEKNKNNQTYIIKDLYSYFSAQGEGMKFLMTGIKEIFKSVTGGMNKTSAIGSSTTGKKETVEIKSRDNSRELGKIKENVKYINDSNYFRSLNKNYV